MFEENQNQNLGDLESWDSENQSVLNIALEISDAELVEIISSKPPGRERNDFLRAALKIGVIALEQAGSRIDADRVRREGDRLVESLSAAMKAHRDETTSEIGRALQNYFDPKSGRFSERVEKLIKEDGELENAIRRQISGDGSVLANTLNSHLGMNSPLFAMLDPTSKDGLIAILARNVESISQEQREAILKEFSLDSKDSALSRMVEELSTKHGEAGLALQEKIGSVMSEFSLDKEDSALSRLVRRVENAQKILSEEFSLDKDGSALARMKKELTTQIGDLSKSQGEFQKEVIEKLADMAARKAESLKATTHGNDFESALFGFVQHFVQAQGDIVTATGSSTGLVRYSKKGDYVVELGPEHAAAGSKIVVEAKQNAACSIDSARTEIEEARKNRGAGVGLFVFSKRIAPPGLDSLVRIGSDVFLVWDFDDERTDIVLKAGLSLAKGLLVRESASANEYAADFDEINRAILEVEKQTKLIDEIEKAAQSVSSGSDRISERADRMRKSLLKQVATLSVSVDAVKHSISN